MNRFQAYNTYIVDIITLSDQGIAQSITDGQMKGIMKKGEGGNLLTTGGKLHQPADCVVSHKVTLLYETGPCPSVYGSGQSPKPNYQLAMVPQQAT